MSNMLFLFVTIISMTSMAALQPIEDVELEKAQGELVIKAHFILETPCVETTGTTALVDSRQRTVTLIQNVKTQDAFCAQVLVPGSSEFTVTHIPPGYYDILDGATRTPLGILIVYEDSAAKIIN